MPPGGYATRAQFKRAQLDHLIDAILEADSDADDAYHCIANEYPARNVQDYINIEKGKLDTMIITKTETNDPIDIPNATKKCMFEYTPKMCENQIVPAGRLLTVLDMRPSTASKSHE